MPALLDLVERDVIDFSISIPAGSPTYVLDLQAFLVQNIVYFLTPILVRLVDVESRQALNGTVFGVYDTQFQHPADRGSCDRGRL